VPESPFSSIDRFYNSWALELAGTERAHSIAIIDESVVAELVPVPCSVCFLCSFFQNSLINFFPVNLHLGRRLDTDAYLVSFNAQYRYHDIVTDDKLLSNSSCQNEHNNLPLVPDTSCIRAFLIFYAYA